MTSSHRKSIDGPALAEVFGARFVVLQELFHWFLISGVAIAVASVSVPTAEIGDVVRRPLDPAGLLVSIAVATLVLLWLIRSKVGTKIFGALFALVVFAGFFTVVSAFFGPGIAILALASAVLLYYGNPRVIVFDFILALGMAGIAASVGFGFRPLALVVVLAALSAYDIAAVYLTGHMVKLGQALLQRKVFFAMIFPESPRGLLSRIGDIGSREGFFFLGTGDFVLPALLAVSVTAAGGPGSAVPVVLGAALGLSATHAIFISQRVRRPMAALPPIALGAILGYAASILMT